MNRVTRILLEKKLLPSNLQKDKTVKNDTKKVPKAYGELTLEEKNNLMSIIRSLKEDSIAIPNIKTVLMQSKEAFIEDDCTGKADNPMNRLAALAHILVHDEAMPLLQGMIKKPPASERPASLDLMKSNKKSLR